MRDRNEDKIKLYLIRHGKTSLNERGCYIGRTDEELSENGRAELNMLREKALVPKVSHVFSGPMKRCMETAEILYPEFDAVIIEDMTEIDFGSFEGKSYMELSGDKDYQEWIDSKGELPFPGGEDLSSFKERSIKAFNMLVERLGISEDDNSVVALICHGGNIMAIKEYLYGGSYYDYMVKNNEIVCIEINTNEKKENE